MPKKPKAPGGLLPHPLAQLRATLGWTREQCAKETGIPAPTIQNIERATTPLTWDQARIIDAAGQPIKTNKAEQEPPEDVPALTAPR
jgi:transcriptional regulator with XRE-family HTH domain